MLLEAASGILRKGIFQRLSPVFPPVLRQTSNPLLVGTPCKREVDENDCETAENIVRFLIRQGADVNALDEEGKTPLYFAWKYAHLVM